MEPLVESGKLGPVLWQLPANFRRDDERLASALEHLPQGRHCFEFRHESWFVDEVYALLRRRGVALVIGDNPKRPFQTHEVTAAAAGTTPSASSRSGSGALLRGGRRSTSTRTSTTTGRATPSRTRSGSGAVSPRGNLTGEMGPVRDEIIAALGNVID